MGDRLLRVALDPSGSFLYVLVDNVPDNETVDELVRVNTATLIPETIDDFGGVDVDARPRDVVIHPTSGDVFVAAWRNDTIYRYKGLNNAASPEGIDLIDVGADGIIAPWGLALNTDTDPERDLLYVASRGNPNGDGVSLLDVSPLQCELGCLEQGPEPGGGTRHVMLFDVDPQTRFLYASNGGANTLSVFSVGVGGSLAFKQEVDSGGKFPRGSQS